jgi:alanine racemase
MLAVALVQEGVELREAGISAPVLILGATDAAEAEAICEHRLTPAVGEFGLARALSQTADKLGRDADCHVKVDSGMGRQGVRGHECEAFGALLRELPRVRVSGVFSHFASCPTDAAFTQEQVTSFHAAVQALETGLGHRPALRHLAASAGILCAPATHLDAVRPGAILYGVADRGYEQHLPRFRPVMSLKARIVATKRLGTGESVGYGRTFVANADTRTALLPLGYADGYPRALGNNADVLIHGTRCPVVGRVSMDCIVADLGDVPQAQVGDEVVLLGAQGEERVTAEELAQRAGTCVQEIVSCMAARLPRVMSAGQ